MKLKRAKSPSELMNMKFKTMGFEGEWLYHLGDASKGGSWFIYGQSSNGKTYYALKMAKYLCQFGRVAYDSIEQGESSTIQTAFENLGMEDVNKNMLLLDKESLLELRHRIAKHKSPDIIFIDSLQTLRYDPEGTRGITYTDYRKLIADFPKKLFVFVSKAKGNNPWNDMADNVKFDSDIKIQVVNFNAIIEGTRYKHGGNSFDIWAER